VRRVVTTTVVDTAGRVVMMSVVGVPVVASSAVTTGRVGPVATTTAAVAASAVTTAVAAAPVVASVAMTVGPRAAVTAAGSVVTTAAVAAPVVASAVTTAAVAVPAGSPVMIGRLVVMMSVVGVPVVASSAVTTGRVGPVATTTAAVAASAVTTADRDRGGSRGRDDRGGFDRRDDRDREPIKRLPIPDDVTGDEIDKDVRQELLSLPKTLAEDVARNLVMVARLIDEDPEQAYAYSRIALRLASRVAAVREAAGFAAYATQKYAEALAEFRAAKRMTGSVELWPVMADCERGLGRPERAMAMAGEPEVQKLDKAGQVEMRLVAAGARRDMGQIDAAIVTLQSSELASNAVHPWTPRLRYAYADALLAAGREDEAREWFAKTVEADKDGSTDASDRLAELDGVEFVDALGDDHDDADEAAEVDADADDEGSADKA
jgi:hypothetical protein